MPREYLPQVKVLVAPGKVSKGQMISIQAFIYDKLTGEPMKFDKIFLEIIDDKGVPVWPVSTVENESSSISKLISTSEMEAGKTYTVRVSPSRKLSPMGSATFEIDNYIIPAAFLVPGLSLIPAALVSYTDSKVKDKVNSDAIIPESLETPKIAWLIYRTEKDAKVCKYCLPHEGEQYRPDDPDLVQIP